MCVTIDNVLRTLQTRTWCVVIVCALVVILEAAALNGDNVCKVKQKYNITKRVKYRAPMSVRTYVWCFSMPPRCSKWNTEMRDLTRLETEERVAEVAVCCPGYKMKDVSCVPICPIGKTGPGCSEDCPDNKWGPNCMHECKRCKNGFCSHITGECECLDGWQGESCDISMPGTTATTSLEELLTSLTTKMTANTTPRATTTSSTTSTTIRTTTIITTTPMPLTTTSITTLATPTTTETTTTPKRTTISITTPLTTKLTAATRVPSMTEMLTTANPLKTAALTTVMTSTELLKPTTVYENTTIGFSTSSIYPTTKQVTEPAKAMDTGDEMKLTTQAMEPEVRTVPIVSLHKKPIEVTTEIPKSTLSIVPSTNPTIETTLKNESTKKDTTIKITPSTTKFKPKEIWIRPAQKGESPIVETKIKTTHEFPRYRSANNKEITPAVTTPKTIIVSIIPTSVSYSSFKKIALTSSYMTTKNISTIQSYNKTEEFTKPMVTETSTPPIILRPLSRKELMSTTYFTNTTSLSSTSVTPKTSTKLTTLVTKPVEVTTPVSATNSMTSEINRKVSTSVTITSSTAVTTHKSDLFMNPITKITFKTSSATQPSTENVVKHVTKHVLTKTSDTVVTKNHKTTNPQKPVEKEHRKAIITKNLTQVTTEEPADDEEFHILTEPEHITAVMGDKGSDRTSVDLISVISIAGGVMMAVITVAVVIVMIERCKKPRYEDVRKVNDIRMQVMIDNNDVPPPYVRSIFHTPLPDPPTADKCHYQPISTLDRNLKQFMRPVVVQTISPIMLENFRGILECHYDHLPRRSTDFAPTQNRSSIAPSLSDCSELRHLRASVTESTIEALKCEAKLDIIDNTTSEPLYAEIPCWRPPSEHAIEIMNLNGEAVTEL